jgi:hypothetical protein
MIGNHSNFALTYKIIAYRQRAIDEVPYSLFSNRISRSSFFLSKNHLYFSTKDKEQQLLEQVFAAYDQDEDNFKNIENSPTDV